MLRSRAVAYAKGLTADELLAKLRSEGIVHPSAVAQAIGLSGRGTAAEVAREIERTLTQDRDPRKPEDWFPAPVVAAAKAAHAEHIRDLPNFTKWDGLPIQSQDDWIRIVHEAIKAYKEAGGQ